VDTRLSWAQVALLLVESLLLRALESTPPFGVGEGAVLTLNPRCFTSSRFGNHHAHKGLSASSKTRTAPLGSRDLFLPSSNTTVHTMAPLQVCRAPIPTLKNVIPLCRTGSITLSSCIDLINDTGNSITSEKATSPATFSGNGSRPEYGDSECGRKSAVKKRWSARRGSQC